ncbi:MAG: L-threonylcarbamoyladenylate synthase [Thermoplasmata archaeon]
MNNVVKVNPLNPDKDVMERAANIIKRGGLVAFPTETVYGLGANAKSDDSCSKIYIAKGRPSDNPLIVHISSMEQLYDVASRVPDFITEKLHTIWPGPLTVVLPKGNIGKVATGGLDTVAVRMPAHKVPLDLIRRSGLPIAAPSANRSGKPSPVYASEVREDLDERVDMIIDGGPAFFGVESTVIMFKEKEILILRPGAFSAEDIREIFGMKVTVSSNLEGAPRAPGMKYRHYAPSKKMFLADSEEYIQQKCRERGNFVVLCSYELSRKIDCPTILLGSRKDLYEVARNLFPSFRKLDKSEYEYGIIEPFEEKGIGLAIMNRIKKATEGK